MGPDRVENEKELDKDATKWQNTAHDNTRNGSCIKHLFGNMSRNWIGADWMLDWTFLIAVIGAKEAQGRRNTHPHEHNGQNSGKRHGSR